MVKIERMDKKISFIGVGPGDPELLTLKAIKKIFQLIQKKIEKYL